MERVKSFVAKLPTWLLVVVAIVLLAMAFWGPQYVGVIPGLFGMAVSLVLMGRAVKSDLAKRGRESEAPWWTQY